MKPVRHPVQPAPMSEGVQQIALAALKLFGLDPGELTMLLSRDRHKSAVAARQVAMWVTRKRYKMSFPTIGAVFGGRDHTSVMAACRRVDRNIEAGSPFGVAALRLLESFPPLGGELAVYRAAAAAPVYEGVVIGLSAARAASNGARELDELHPSGLELDWGPEGPPRPPQGSPGVSAAEAGGARSDAPKEPT